MKVYVRFEGNELVGFVGGGGGVHTNIPHATILWIFSTSGVPIHTAIINMEASVLYGRSHLGMKSLPILFTRAPAPITTSSWSKFMYCDTLCVSHLWASIALVFFLGGGG